MFVGTGRGVAVAVGGTGVDVAVGAIAGVAVGTVVDLAVVAVGGDGLGVAVGGVSEAMDDVLVA